MVCWTLGRQTLLDPIEWTADGWFEARGGDLSRPLVKPTANESGPHGHALSDDFSRHKLDIQWGFYDPGVDEVRRVRFTDNTLFLRAKGAEPRDTIYAAGAGEVRIRDVRYTAL
jgi:xylan 1,4-beta-xylosidase